MSRTIKGSLLQNLEWKTFHVSRPIKYKSDNYRETTFFILLIRFIENWFEENVVLKRKKLSFKKKS